MIPRADSLAPAFQRAAQLLQAGQFGRRRRGIRSHRRGHARARAGPRRPPTGASPRRDAAAPAADCKAHAGRALRRSRRESTRSAWRSSSRLPRFLRPRTRPRSIASLREVAEAAVAAREASRRARQHAEGARERMTQVRLAAQAQAGRNMRPLFGMRRKRRRRSKATAFAREAYEDAGAEFRRGWHRISPLRGRRGEAQRREHGAAEQAREQVAQPRARSGRGCCRSTRESCGTPRRQDPRKRRRRSPRTRLAARASSSTKPWPCTDGPRRPRVRPGSANSGAPRRRAIGGAGARARPGGRRSAYAREQWDAAEAEVDRGGGRLHPTGVRPGGAGLRRGDGHVSPPRGGGARGAAPRARVAEQATRADGAGAARCRLRAAPQYAPALWEEAEATPEAEAAFEREAFVEASEAFEAAGRRLPPLRGGGPRGRGNAMPPSRHAGSWRRLVSAHRRRELRSTRQTVGGGGGEVRRGAGRLRCEVSEARRRSLQRSAVLYARAEEASLEAMRAERRARSGADTGDNKVRAGRPRSTLRNMRPPSGTRPRRNSRRARRPSSRSSMRRPSTRSTELLLSTRRRRNRPARRDTDSASRLSSAPGDGGAPPRRRRRDAASHAPSDWHDAETSAESGEAALAREAYAEASDAFDRAPVSIVAPRSGRATSLARSRSRTPTPRRRATRCPARHAAPEAQASSTPPISGGLARAPRRRRAPH